VYTSARKPAVAPASIKYSQRTFRPQTIFQALYAQDGESIVYSAAPTGNTPYLYTLRPEFTEPLKVSDAPLQLLSISSKGELAVLTEPEWVAHRVCVGTLARMPLGGGAPREIMEEVFQASWNPDGTDLAIVRPVEGVVRLEYPPGKVLFQSGGYVSDVRFSPDGKHIAYFEHPAKFDDRGDVAVVDMTGKRTLLSTGYWGLEGIAWSADGGTVYFSGGTGYADFSVYAASLTGEVRVAAQSAGGLVIHDISPKGTWMATRDDLRRVMLVRPPGASDEIDMSWQELSEPIDLSGDGRTLVFTESGTAAGANYQVCMRRTDGSAVVVLGEGGATDLSEDGRWVLAGIFPNRVIAYPTGAGQPIELNTKSIELISDARWLPGQKQVLLVGGAASDAGRCYLIDVAGGAPRELTERGVLAAFPSPDGRRMLVFEADGLTWSLAAIDSAAGRAPAPALNADDVFSSWQADGRGVYVIRQNHVPNAVEAVDLASGNRRRVATLDPKMPGVLYIRSVAISPDERAYSYGALTYISRLYSMEGAH
jgi:Tol biopolymer transport system component